MATAVLKLFGGQGTGTDKAATMWFPLQAA